MTDPISVPARSVPAPSSISEAAREALALRMPPPRYPPADDIAAWDALREAMDEAAQDVVRHLLSSVHARIRDEHIGGVPVYEATPAVPRPGREPLVNLELHGGGLWMGGGAMARALAGLTADMRGARVVSPEYRLPPEHPFPAALDDCFAVYAALVEQYGAEHVVVSGASAGGNLAAAVTLRARDEGVPMPRALLLLSPEVDLTESGDTFATLDGVDSLASLSPVNAVYAAGHDLKDPYLSPLFADFSRGFPPTFLQSGTRDLFLSNTVRMHRALHTAGVAVECFIFEARPHLGFGGRAPEDFEVVAEVDRFLSAVLAD